jgi:hypothetical protein
MAELTTNINYLQPTGFKVVIDRKKFGNLEFFAQTVEHPSVAIETAEIPFRRVNLHMAGDKLTFGQLSANIILDENMSAYTEMYDWVQRLVTETNTTKFDTRYDNDPTTTVDISVIVLSSNNNQVKRIKYVDCVPVDIGSVSFQATTQDVQYLTFPVTFSFSYFEIV